MAFQVNEPSYNSRTKHYFANPQISIQLLEAYRKSYLHFIYCWAAVALYKHTLPYTSLRMRNREV